MIKELRNRLDKRSIGAVELTKEYLSRIEKSDLNSYITVCTESAIKTAEKAQQLIDEGRQAPLTGIPMSIKDNICTADIKTTCASKMLSDFVPVYDASAVSRLKNQGAVILGKTNMDEFGMGGSSQTSYFGGVKNPHNKDCTAGGSSGGAAAAVSADLCVGALGSDTGGSVRQPASFCGVCGLKPTYGAVSRYGLVAFASSLEQIGTIAKSAYDCACIFNQISGLDKNDATTHTADDAAALVGTSIKGMKIGIPKEFFADGIDDEVKEKVMAMADAYRQMGCILIDVSLPSLEYAVAAYYLISSAEAASNLSRFDGIRFGHCSDKGGSYNERIMNTRAEGFGDEVKRRIMLGNYALSHGYYDEYYKKAMQIRTRICAEYDSIFEKCDVILTPTAPTTAYKIGTQENNPTKMYLADICTVPVNLAGLPAVSVMCGFDKNNMPVGASLVGRKFDEKTIIALADRYEEETR